MSRQKDRALERLRKLADESQSRMDIPEIIEAVLGSCTDNGLEALVRIALESSLHAMSLEEIANGILGIQSWREGNT
ncbi:MAG: hypothetical protein QGG21_02395 [Candidatus Thalassarchaeaceae archaeon]|jgi:hypothetical protein|nr:hypothetical protein [Candidatus Thalassarchaeaceae archaeon]